MYIDLFFHSFYCANLISAKQSKNSFLPPLALLLLVGSNANAQSPALQDPAAPTVEKVLTTLSVNYLGAAIQQARGISPMVTFLYGAGVHNSFYSTQTPPLFGSRFINSVDKYFGRNYSTQRLVPYLVAEVRLYKTLFKRSVRGRDTRANCANYLALVGEIPFASGDLINMPNLELAYPVGVKYGMRRPLGQRLYVEGSFGGFLKISRSQQTFTPRIDLALGLHH